MAIEIVRGGIYRLLLGPTSLSYSEVREFVDTVVKVAAVDKYSGVARLDNGWWVQLEELAPVNCYGFGKWFKEHNNA